MEEKLSGRSCAISESRRIFGFNIWSRELVQFLSRIDKSALTFGEPSSAQSMAVSTFEMRLHALVFCAIRIFGGFKIPKQPSDDDGARHQRN